MTGTPLRNLKEFRNYYNENRAHQSLNGSPPGERFGQPTPAHETKAGHFEPQKFEDQYERALKELIRQKQSGRPIELYAFR